MKKALITFVVFMLPMMASAKLFFENIPVGDLYYNFYGGVVYVSCASYQNDYYVEGEKERPGDWYNIKSFYSGSVVIPPEITYNGITYSVTGIDHYAFYNCSGLTSITIPSSVTYIGADPFQGCSGLTSIVVESGNTVYDSRDNCNAIISSEYNSLILGCKNTVIPNSVTSIGSSAFNGCSGLTSINIPDDVTSIGYGAFYNCSGLTSIIIPNKVTTIGSYAFQNCSGLTSINIPDNVTSINQGTFDGCSSLTSITIPDGVTSIGYNAFDRCGGLTSVTIGASVSDIKSNVFSNCSNLTDLYCLAVDAPTINEYTFSKFNKGNATLHVPAASIELYNNAPFWSGFKEIVPLADDGQQVETCATPTISFEKGEFVFSCETEGVTFHYEISRDSSGSTTGNSSGTANKVTAYAPISVTVSVYATKTGYYRSETATATFTGKFGDLNGDGNVDVGDHVELTNIIMAQ